jgi:hypothetical protein
MARILTGLALVIACGSSALADALPQDAARYIDRREGCNHWAGEEGYDGDRRAEINRNIAALKCTRLDRDEQRLLHRYRHHPAIRDRIHAAHDALL